MCHLHKPSLFLVLVLSAGVTGRIVAAALLANPHGTMTTEYFETAASLVSYGTMLMRSPSAVRSANRNGGWRDVKTVMQQAQARGDRLSRDAPYPTDPIEWLPATLHPPGYALLIAGLYVCFNYKGMLIALLIFQLIADLLTSCFIFVLAKRLLGEVTAQYAAMAYLLLPPAVISCSQMLPEAYTPFWTALTLMLASLGVTGSRAWFLAAGVTAGLAAQFRSELLILSAVVFVLALAVPPRRFGAWQNASLVVLGTAFVLLPWIAWTYRTVGVPMLITTNSGGSMYQALGEDPQDDPWHIQLKDAALEELARKQGFASPWSHNADLYFKRQFLLAVKQHFASYILLILRDRLPFALAPPYEVRDNQDRAAFSFSRLRERSSLTKWQVVTRYPGLVIKRMWSPLLMMLCSFLMLLATLGALWHLRRQRAMLWLLLPWISIVLSMSVLKQIEPRNMTAILVPQILAVGCVAERALHGRGVRRAEWRLVSRAG